MKRLAWTGAALAVLLTSGCGTDNREQIAMATLYHDAPAANQARTPMRPFPEMTGALNEKFPAGTDLGDLKRYVANLSGTCGLGKPLNPGELTCSLVESAAFCVRNSIVITARADAMSKIEHIEAHRLFEGC